MYLYKVHNKIKGRKQNEYRSFGRWKQYRKRCFYFITGTPEQVAQNPNSFTGQYLKPVLERAWKLQGTAPAPVPEEPGCPAPAEEKASAQPPRKRKKADKK